MSLKTAVYIDGFNLYYSVVRSLNARWVDLRDFAQRSFPDDQIQTVRYYTAIVHKTNGDSQKPKRQRHYTELLMASGVEVVYGSFTRHKAWMTDDKGQSVRVVKVQEKGSDVNLATDLLRDAYSGQFEQAVVVSNDSDLKHPVRHVAHELGKRVVILQPVLRPSGASVALASASTASVLFDASLFCSCTFPDRVQIGTSQFQRPASW